MTTMPEGTTTSGVGMLQGVALASDVLNASITLGTPAMNLNQTQNMPAATTESATAMPNTGRGAQGISVAIDDLIVDTSSGKIKYIVIDTSFGNDEHWIPVPLNLLQWDSGNQAFVLNTDVTALQNAPSFQGGQYPDTSSNGWDGDLSNYWQNK